jgi:solute carrier family 25 carnitine/acylcarnitine transporter 20/29
LETAGMRALWRGASPMITAVPLQNAVLMGGYGGGKRYAEQYAPEHKLAAVFVGGSTGGFWQSFLMSPVEYIKVTQQCAGGRTAGTAANTMTASSAVWKLIWQSDGVFWRRGLGATMLRDSIPHGVWFTTYEVTKQELTAYYKSVRDEVHLTQNVNNVNISSIDDTSSEEVLVPLVAGAWAATAAWTVGYPADLIKTRIQSSTSNLGIIGTGQLLIKESGGSVITGLYRGFGLKLVRSVPASMIGFSVYEYVKKHIESSL